MRRFRGEKARRERRPGASGRSVLLVLAGALALAYLGGWRVMGGRAAREVERLRRQGEPLRPSALVTKLKPGEKNAADLYEQAFPITFSPAMRSLPQERLAQWTTAELAAAQTLVAGNPQYFELLERATRIKTCSFAIDWDDPAHAFTQVALLRRAAEALRAQAGVLAYRGDGEGALRMEAALFRMAAQAMQAPSVAGSSVGADTDGTAFDDLPFVLDRGRLSPAACRALSAELAKQDPTKAIVRGLKGSRAEGLRIFEAMESGSDLSGMLVVSEPEPHRAGLRTLRAYPRVGMPVWYRDKAIYLEVMRDLIDAAGHPWPQADTEMRAAVGRVQALGGATTEMARILASGLDATALARARTTAKLRLAQLALTLKAYQAEHGQYPASLVAAGGPLPTDPFAGTPFHYRRDPKGFTIWGTGPDMVDNKGAQPRPPGVPQRAAKGGYGSGCDCVMRCMK